MSEVRNVEAKIEPSVEAGFHDLSISLCTSNGDRYMSRVTFDSRIETWRNQEDVYTNLSRALTDMLSRNVHLIRAPKGDSITNGDRIRCMSDGDLAMLYASKVIQQAFLLLPLEDGRTATETTRKLAISELYKATFTWLMQEAKILN